MTIATTGHDVSDHRIYDKQARSLMAAGASVRMVGPQRKNGQDLGPAHMVVQTPAPKNRLQRFLRQPWRCWNQIKLLETDILHIHDAELLQILPWARLARADIKVVYDVHEDFANLIMVRRYLPHALKPCLKTMIDVMEKRLAKWAHGIVGVTDPLAECFENDQSIAAYNFPSRRFYLDAEKHARPGPLRRYDLVHLGTLSLERAEFLAAVLQILHHRRKNTKTLITGAHPPILKYLKRRVPAGCDLEGKRPYAAVPNRLGDARIGIDIHPFDTPNLDVAVPVKVFEYMAAGCAVVTSQLPVLEKLFLDSAIQSKHLIRIKGGTPEIYAHAVQALLDQFDNGQDTGPALAQAARSNYVWESEAEKLVRFYLELLH